MVWNKTENWESLLCVDTAVLRLVLVYTMKMLNKCRKVFFVAETTQDTRRSWPTQHDLPIILSLIFFDFFLSLHVLSFFFGVCSFSAAIRAH